MFRRVAHTVVVVEVNYKEDSTHWKEVFFDLMAILHFPPNSPTLLASIFQAVKDMVLIHQSGGGTYFGCEGCVGSKRFSGRGA